MLDFYTATKVITRRDEASPFKVRHVNNHLDLPVRGRLPEVLWQPKLGLSREDPQEEHPAAGLEIRPRFWPMSRPFRSSHYCLLERVLGLLLPVSG